MQQRIHEWMQKVYGDSSASVECFFAPGRVNIIGEHTDYNGGYVFPAALTMGIYGGIRRRGDQGIYLASADHERRVCLNSPADLEFRREDGWANYPKGVIRYLVQAGYQLPGCEIVYAGNLPEGAGLSSSAALLVLTLYMMIQTGKGPVLEPEMIPRICRQVENEYMKVNCGIMDHFAVAMGKKGCALLLDCESLQYSYVPADLGEYQLVIMNTEKKRELTESMYNTRWEECQQALGLLRRQRPIEHLCQALPEEINMYVADEKLRKRAVHVVTENRRVLRAVSCLQEKKLGDFGQLLTESHWSLKNNYEVSGVELDLIVEAALREEGCLGARMTGAGFGGCAIALVHQKNIVSFQAHVKENYQAQSGRVPSFYVSGIGDGVRKWAP